MKNVQVQAKLVALTQNNLSSLHRVCLLGASPQTPRVGFAEVWVKSANIYCARGNLAKAIFSPARKRLYNVLKESWSLKIIK